MYFCLEPPRSSPQQDMMGVTEQPSPQQREEPEPPDLVEYPQTSSTVSKLKFCFKFSK